MSSSRDAARGPPSCLHRPCMSASPSRRAQADLERTEVTKRIAEQEARIAATRQRSQTPESLTYECLRITADWDAQRQGPMPQTWQCLNPQGNPVIVGR
jgi:hypothetical protein